MKHRKQYLLRVSSNVTLSHRLRQQNGSEHTVKPLVSNLVKLKTTEIQRRVSNCQHFAWYLVHSLENGPFFKDSIFVLTEQNRAVSVTLTMLALYETCLSVCESRGGAGRTATCGKTFFARRNKRKNSKHTDVTTG